MNARDACVCDEGLSHLTVTAASAVRGWRKASKKMTDSAGKDTSYGGPQKHVLAQIPKVPPTVRRKQLQAPVGRACTPSGGAEDASGSQDAETQADDHGYPMIRGLVSRLMHVDVVEAYSPPRVTKGARKYGLKPGEAWDLTEGWDSG